MRICIDISQAVYEGTGSGRYVLELVRGLLSQDKQNEYILFGSAMRRRSFLGKLADTFKADFPKEKLDFKLFPFPPKFYEVIWNSMNIIPLETFTGKVDVYHSSDWVEASSKAKRVTTVHDLIPFLFPDQVHPRIRDAHEKRWSRIEQDIDCIIVDAEVTKQDILHRFSVPASKITVIPLACDDRFFAVGKARVDGTLAEQERTKKVLKNYGLSAQGYVLAVGTLEPRKNIARLIDAYGKLDETIRNKYPLVVVGKKSWSSELPQTKGVILTGYVDDADLPYLYANSRCYVMPSLYEGFGLPVLEAMASGAPVICSNRSSLPEIGGEEVHYIEDPLDVESIRVVLAHVLESDPEELLTVAKNAYARATQFSWKRTAQETLHVYNRLYEKGTL